jgi:hypothetical protein
MSIRTFETRGPVSPTRNYVVPRTEEIADLVQRIKDGRYIVIFAPRQTGKTTFFRWALDALVASDDTYVPIKLNFETCKNLSQEAFYSRLKKTIRKELEKVLLAHRHTALQQFLEDYAITCHSSMISFFEQLGDYLKNRRLTIIIDEFDGIPQSVVSDFLHALREIYLSEEPNRCPYSVGIVGVTQLNYDRSISPFNIQDEFALPNFTVSQMRTLLGQYTEEVGQAFAPAVIDNLHKQTAGQPFLVNRIAQILTHEMGIAREETISLAHFETAHQQILNEQNVHLTTNIRRHPRFETLLMDICSYDAGIPFNIRNEFISELVTYGVLKAGRDGFCEIANPIYQYCIVQTFQPLSGLSRRPKLGLS